MKRPQSSHASSAIWEVAHYTSNKCKDYGESSLATVKHMWFKLYPSLCKLHLYVIIYPVRGREINVHAITGRII